MGGIENARKDSSTIRKGSEMHTGRLNPRNERTNGLLAGEIAEHLKGQ